MKIISTLFMCLLIFSASTCKKEGGDCHYKITIANNSSKKIIWAINANGVYGCRLDGEELESGTLAEYRPYNTCIESSMANEETEHIFIIDTTKYNDPDVYFDCDSIEFKNKVLKHYVLTLDDLKNSDFVITYQ